MCYPVEMPDQPPNSVLVYVGFDRIGDGLLKLPFVRGLRLAFPDARITWLAGKEDSVYAGVLADLAKGQIDEVIEHAGIGVKPGELLRRIPKSPLDGRRFDLIIDTQRTLWTSLSLWRVAHGTFISPAARFLLSSKKTRNRLPLPENHAAPATGPVGTCLRPGFSEPENLKSGPRSGTF